MTFDATKLFNIDALPGADKFQTLFADAGERSQEIVRKSQKAAEQLAEIAKANVEALTEAGRIAATGARTIGQDAIASGRDGIEQASAAVKTLAEAKSPTEFFQLQSELVRASFDRAVAEGSKLTEQLVKLAGEAVQPLSTRASLNAERINELAA
jgi:phasin family protein